MMDFAKTAIPIELVVGLKAAMMVVEHEEAVEVEAVEVTATTDILVGFQSMLTSFNLLYNY